MVVKRLRRPAVTADGNEEIAELPRSPVPRGDRRSRSRHRRDHLPPTGESPGRELEEQLKDDSAEGPAPAAALDNSHGQESVKSTVSKKTKFPHMDVQPASVDTALESTQLPTPTKGMRYLFRRDFHLLPKNVQAEYNRFVLSREPGKQKEMNRIILLAVKQQGGEYRGTVETNDRHWLHYFNKSEEKYAHHGLVGYSYTEIKARLGSADEVTAGKARGDIVVSVDSDGRQWYHLGRQSSGLKRQARHVEEIGQTNSNVIADDVHIATEDIGDEDWLKFTTSLSQMAGMSNSSASSHKSPAAARASDMVVRKVHEAYEVSSKVSKNLRSKSLELSGKVDTAITSGGLHTARTVSSICDQIEDMLIQDSGSLPEHVMMSKLLEFSKLYKDMKAKEREVLRLHKTFCKQIKADTPPPYETEV